ncbi:RagB/SusD family nutrient uptake outer membrane protein [uncultured Alistipes sp.]|uniref:RagB/SusD family nutrient uptake outer membrane protein n=1 Tax=uncultured Alistipes sp. TaxID=538949 RepID=UPI0026245F55|nr:RagB/SusD family nutrient uptake outer membrane protein [uncultured Alistipes sp.]
MKKIIWILLAAPLALAACSEDADVTAYLTEGAKNEIAANDPDKVFAAQVNGMYTDMQQYVNQNMQHNYFGQKSFDYLTSLMGNDMVMTDRFGMSIYHYLCDYGAENYVPTTNRWREYYRVIDTSNQILGSIAEDETNPDVLKYKAIALGMRGYAYLQLTYLYQFSYYVGADGTKWGKGAKYDWSQEPCVPIVTETITGQQPRSTVAQVYEQLMGDLKGSYDIFDAIGMTKTSTPTDFDGCVAALHLARANMVIHQWDEAIKYAQVVIDNYPVLRGEEQLLQGFSDITLPDIVFGCDITSDNTTVYMSWFSQMDAYATGYGGTGVWRVGFKPLVDRIADSDIRLQWFNCDRSTGIDYKGGRATLLRDTRYAAPVEYQSVKFIGAGRDAVLAGYKPETGAPGWQLGDYIYLRSEEAYMIKIEALAHKGDASAVAELESFMRTRQPDYTCPVSAKADLLEEINFQKRVEFWGEGIEYLDNRRLNIPIDRSDATWGAADNNHFDGGKLRIEQENTMMRYQLPLSEIENNKMISIADQNPL